MSKSFVNPLSQLDINRKFEKYISISIYNFHRGSFMNYVFIAYKNDAWCHFVEVSKYISPSQMNLIFTTYTNINSLKLKTVVKKTQKSCVTLFPFRSLKKQWWGIFM